MTGTLDDFCDELMRDESPARRLEPERLAVDFPRFFGLSGRPTLGELAEVFERAGIGKVSPARLPGALRGIHYTLCDESYAIHYQEDQWEGSSEYTLLHEAYEIVNETLWKRGHDQPPERKVCLDADRFAAAALMRRTSSTPMPRPAGWTWWSCTVSSGAPTLRRRYVWAR